MRHSPEGTSHSPPLSRQEEWGKRHSPAPYIPAFFIPVSRSAIFFETLPPFRLS